MVKPKVKMNAKVKALGTLEQRYMYIYIYKGKVQRNYTRKD